MKNRILFLIFFIQFSFIYPQSYKILHQFSGEKTDGRSSHGGLVLCGSELFGMTTLGGEVDTGTIYKINPDGSGFKLIHSFNRDIANGRYPSGSLILVDSILYGTTTEGGAKNVGTIFKIKPDGTDFEVIYNYIEPDDFRNPYGTLTISDSDLYGTNWGGIWSRGSLFKVGKDGSGYKILKNFHPDSADGSYPLWPLLISDNTIYGTTWGRNSKSDSGNVFKINTDGTEFKILHSFLSVDGNNPTSSLIRSNNSLYGVTYGGISDAGTVYKINMDGSGFELLHSFKGGNSDGSYPYGNLILSGDYLFGKTYLGGKGSCGTIFRIKKDGTGFSLLYSFEISSKTEVYPEGDLLLHNGSLYGTTFRGGSKNFGTIFKLSDIHFWDSCESNSFHYPFFPDSNEFVLKGKTKLNDSNVRLTPTIKVSTGSIFYFKPVMVSVGFRSSFSFRFSNGYNDFDDGSPAGADGIAFVIQSNSLNQIGSSGGGIGYSGIPNSLAIEFDSYNNGSDFGESDGSHLAVFSNGKQPNSSNHNSSANLMGTSKIPILLADSTIYYGKVEYSGSDQKLTVWLDKTGDFLEPVLFTKIPDLSKLIDLIDGNKAYIGFTSSTGTSYQNTDLLSWTFCNFGEKNISSNNDDLGHLHSDMSFHISPNPATDFIEISQPSEGSSNIIRIFNVFGEVVKTSPPAPLQVERGVRIDVSSLAPGVYFVRIVDRVERFIKI